MKPILFVGHPLGSSLGLVAALETLKISYQFARVSMPADFQSPAYKNLNDRQQTPVLMLSDGTILTETMAIAQWLMHQDREHQISFPQPSSAELDLIKSMAFINSSYTTSFIPLWLSMEVDSLSETDTSVLHKIGTMLTNKSQKQLEHLVPASPFFYGNTPTLTDFLFAGVGRWADFHQVFDLQAYPKTAQWKEAIFDLPQIQLAEQIEQGSFSQTDFGQEIALDVALSLRQQS